MLKQPSRQQLWTEPFLGGSLSESSLQIDPLCAAGQIPFESGWEAMAHSLLRAGINPGTQHEGPELADSPLTPLALLEKGLQVCECVSVSECVWVQVVCVSTCVNLLS